MEKNGQNNYLLEKINKYNGSKDSKENSRVARIHKSDIGKLVGTVKDIGKSKDIASIVNCERMLIANDLDKLIPEKMNDGTLTSLKSAHIDLERSYKLIAYVKDIKGYQSYESSVSLQAKDRINGLPKDAFHRFIDSNITRINNAIISPKTSYDEKIVLTERKSNMKIAKEEYMKLQAIALEIKLPEKSKEHER